MNPPDAENATEHDAPDGREGRVERVSRWLASASILGMFALLNVELIGRNLFHLSFDFTLEISGYLLVASFFFSLASCHASGAFHRVEVFRGRLDHEARRRLDTAFDVVVLAVCLVILWYLARFELLTWQRGEMSNTTIRTPLAIPRAVMPIGMALLCYAIVIGVARRLYRRSGLATRIER